MTFLESFDKNKSPEMFLSLYRIGNKVLANAIVKAKPNYIYNTNIPVEYRPKNPQILKGQYYHSEAGLSTVTIQIGTDGTLKTVFNYQEGVITAFAVWNIE